ncbi:MAG: hypothetical protein KC535_00600 [Nanoarchaeota archaeon]|nr:hypothetical protein [Nanoarchaeota archaeon]
MPVDHNKIVFLDVDGPLTNEEQWYKLKADYYGIDTSLDQNILKIDSFYAEQERKRRVRDFILESPLPPLRIVDHSPPFLEDAVNRIHRLYDQTSCSFVLSSQWRIGLSLEQIQMVMERSGLQVPFVGKTQDSFTEHRAYLIREYLTQSQASSYVIIDDINFEGFELFFGERFIQTPFTTCVSEENIEKAISLLNK